MDIEAFGRREKMLKLREERLAHQLIEDFHAVAATLQCSPYRNPVLRSDVFPAGKYRKPVFNKWYLLIHQIKGEKVFIEYVIDGRQDYRWPLIKA